MKQIATPALAVFLLSAVATTANDEATERAANPEMMDMALAEASSVDPDGWRFYRLLQRVESITGKQQSSLG